MCIIKPIEAAEYNGKLYRSPKEAATVALQEIGSGIVAHGAANAGVKILENADSLRKLLDILKPQEKTPPADDNHPIDREAIPLGVYYGGEAGNFYDAKTRRGQGQPFMDKWFPRRNEFPADAKTASRAAITAWLVERGYEDVDDFQRRASYDQKSAFETFMATQPDFSKDKPTKAKPTPYERRARLRADLDLTLAGPDKRLRDVAYGLLKTHNFESPAHMHERATDKMVSVMYDEWFGE